MTGLAPAVPRCLWWALPATFLLLIPLPVGAITQRWPSLIEAIQNAAHVPLFAALTLLACSVLDWYAPAPRRNLILAMILAIGFGGITEYVQAQLGRDSSWADLGNDLVGAVGAVFYRIALRAREQRRTGAFRAAAAGVLALAVVATWPPAWTLAAYFERWRSAPVIWRDDSPLLRHFSPTQRWASPVLHLAEVPPDWRDIALVEIDAANLYGASLELTVRAHDAAHDQQHADRYNETFTLGPGEHRVLRIPVERIRVAPSGREMDLSHMRAIAVFQNPRGARRFSIREIRLVPRE